MIGWLYHRSIKGLLVILVLVVLIPHLLSETVHYYNLFQERRAEEYRLNLEISRSVAAIFDAYVRDILNQELAIGISLSTSRPLPDDQIDRLLTASAGTIPSVRHYQWVSPQGRVILSSPPSVSGLDLSDRPYFRQIEDGKEWTVSDLFQGQGQIDGELMFVVARGIRDVNGDLKGVVEADVNPERLGEILHIRQSDQTSIAIIDSQGRDIYLHPETGQTWEQRDWLSQQPLVKQALDGEEISGSFSTSIDNENRIASYTPIRSIGWVASASRTEKEAMAVIVQELLRESAQELVIGGLALLLVFYFGHYIGAPIRRLQELAAAIGRREFGQSPAITGPIELEQVAEVFNSMVEEIQRYEEQREKHISLLKKSETELRASEERYRILAEAAQDMIFVINRDGNVEYVNSIAAMLIGLPAEQIIGKPQMDLFPADIAASQEQVIRRVFETGESIYADSASLFENNEIWLGTRLVPFKNEAGEVIAVLGVSRDITERKRQEQQLEYLATHDPLTGLPSRRALEAALERVVARARRGFVSTLLFLDVDNFKKVNDTLGHAAGDEALITLARLLQAELRVEDQLFRLGGDEFAVLLEDTINEQTQLVAERMCRVVRKFSSTFGNHQFELGLSIGATTIDGQYGAQQLLAQADTAMYKAKAQGGNRALLYVQ